MSVFNIGPNAPLRNPSINTIPYAPQAATIQNIILGRETVIEFEPTSDNRHYVDGQLCRLIIPAYFGTRELNGVLGYVKAIIGNQVILNIDSSQFTPFKPNPPFYTTPAQILPIGDLNYGIKNPDAPNLKKVYIPGAFIRK